MDDAVPFQVRTLVFFTNPALSYFTNFSLHYFTNFSKLEKNPQNKHTPPNPNQQPYPIQKHYLKSLICQWLADKHILNSHTLTNSEEGRSPSKNYEDKKEVRRQPPPFKS